MGRLGLVSQLEVYAMTETAGQLLGWTDRYYPSVLSFRASQYFLKRIVDNTEGKKYENC